MAAVRLHIYRLADTCLGRLSYHAGVEVYGKEWCFSMRSIMHHSPGRVPEEWKATGWTHLEPEEMGNTVLNETEVQATVDCMRGRLFADGSYNTVHRNCCTFARRFLEELGVRGMPEWVDAYTGKFVPIVESTTAGGVTLECLLVVAGATRAAAGPVVLAAVAGDLVCGGLGARCGATLLGLEGARLGKEMGSLGGAVAGASGLGALLGGPVGAALGAGVGATSYAASRAVHGAIKAVTIVQKRQQRRQRRRSSQRV
mmetsp:Transcript_88633/g.185231  ORF Transcript_88633/g.185231 Transcript_88633/m.185231 type:complete len:257 (-) Transcript_88633:536-1306(-)